MKKFPRKLLSALLACSTAASLVLSPLAAVIGSDLYVYDSEIQTGTVLTHGVYWGATAQDKRTENFITYTPSSAVTPIVTYGSCIASTGTVSGAAKALEAAGYRVVAGMNGDYYYTSNGVPMGMVVTDGILRSGYNNTWAIGFYEDGTAIMGDPKLSLSMEYTYTAVETLIAEDAQPEREASEEGEGESGADTEKSENSAEETENFEAENVPSEPEETIPDEAAPDESGAAAGETITQEVNVQQKIYTVNKARSNTGIFLYTNDFNAKGTTGTTEAGVDVVLVPANEGDDAQLRIGSTMELIVESVTEKTGATAVPEGKIVLSVNKNSSAENVNALKNMAPGMAVTLTIGAEDGWESVKYATSGYKKLLVGGEVAGGLDTTGAPRTAIGQKADGTLVFYTIDGRQSGHSVGASETLLAQRLQQLGCVSAICLDGGGSTTMTATLPNSTTAQTINKPSGGSERAVSTQIFLVSTGAPGGEMSHYYIPPVTGPVLSGAAVQLTATAVDTNYIPMTEENAAADTLTWTTDRGSINENGLFTAPAESGTATITVRGGAYTGSTTIQVVENPDSLVARVDGNVVTSLETKPGASHAFILSAVSNHMTLISQNKCFRFEVTGDIGTITEDGVFTAAQDGEGEIVISAGTATLRIPVTVRSMPFLDVAPESWYFGAVQYVYEEGLMQGGSAAAFQPLTTTSRSMIVQILYNKEGRPASAYTGRFEDVGESAWYMSAVEWAAEQGIVSGNGANAFAPDGEITREQMALILYNYAAYAGFDTGLRSDLSAFSDSGDIHPWAYEAMQWCVGVGLLRGSGGALNPLGTASRAEIAQVLMNFGAIFGDGDGDEMQSEAEETIGSDETVL